MVNKTSEVEIETVIDLVFNKGETLKSASLKVGRHQSVLSKILRNRGYTIPKETGKTTRKDLPVKQIIELYESGISELAISRKIGVSRCAIRQRLVENNIEIRGQSEASIVSAKQFTPEQRKARVRAANEKLRGSKQPKEGRIKRAITLQENPYEYLVGHGEIELKGIFESNQVEHSWQHAIDIYSLDFKIGSVALELKSGMTARGSPDVKNGRIKFLRQHGIFTIYVAFDSVNSLISAYEYILNEVEKANKDIPLDGEYWVITCRTKRDNVFRNSLGQFESEPCEPELVCKTVKRAY